MNVFQLAKVAAEQSSDSKPGLSLKNNPLSNFLRGDDKGLDWRWGAAGGFLNPLSHAPHMYVNNAAVPFFKNYKGVDPGDVGHDLANKLTQFAESKGMTVNPLDRLSSEFMPQSARDASYLVRPGKNPAITYGTHRNASAIAHEIGHALAPKFVFNPYTIGLSNAARNIGGGLGTVGALLSRDEANSRRSAIAGSLAQVPSLGIELDASIRGARLLRNLGAKSGMGAFVGLPSYALMAAAPLGAHYTKKLLGGFENRKTAADNSIVQLIKKAFSGLQKSSPSVETRMPLNFNYNSSYQMPQNNVNTAITQNPKKFSLANMAKDFTVAAGLSTLGTTAGLGLASLAARAAGVPVASKLFYNAGKESLLFFNPFRSYRLLKRLPEASSLAARQGGVIENALKLKSDDLMQAAFKPNTVPNAINKLHNLRDDSARFQALHGESAMDTLEKGIGVANGIMNLGVGGLVGVVPHFMPENRKTAADNSIAELAKQIAYRLVKTK